MLNTVLNTLSRIAPKSETIAFLRAAQELRWRLHDGHQAIYLEYPVSPTPRYGFGKPPHRQLFDIVDRYRADYEQLMCTFKNYQPGLSRIPTHKSNDLTEPYWINGFFGGLEAIGLYCLPHINNTKLYIEIGSGNSTKFVRRSIKDHDLKTRVISIDPNPRAEIDALCDEIIRQPLESVDLDIFSQLAPGDILLFDGSHRCFQNSDVTVFFMEILPKIKTGVLVYIDDIYLPYDYPPAWKNRFYSEQYILAAVLLANPDAYRVLLPCVYIAEDVRLREGADDLLHSIEQSPINGYGSGIWLEVKK